MELREAEKAEQNIKEKRGTRLKSREVLHLSEKWKRV